MTQHNLLELTDAQRWVLATTALLTYIRNGAQDYFGGGVPVKHSLWAREQLKNTSVNTLADLYRRFNQEFHYIPKPLVISKGIDGDGEIYISFKAGALFPPDEDDDTFWIHRNKLGWRLMHVSHLAGLAYVACMVTPEKAWEVATECAEIIQTIFTSWDEVLACAKSSLTIGDIAADDGREKLLEENGLWTIPWNTPIKNVPRPPEGRRIIYVGVNRDIEKITGLTTYTFEDALAISEEGDCIQLAGGVYPGPWQINKCVEIVAQQPNVICQASEDAPASVVIADAFVLMRNVKIISPGGGARGQVAIGCLSGTLLLERTTISSSGHGMSVAKPARAMLYGCLVDACSLNGIVVEGKLEASNSSFLNTQYHTVNVTNQGRADFAFCLFKQSGSHLLSVENGSYARVMDSTFEQSTQAALVVTQESTLEITRAKCINAGLIALKAKRCFLLDSHFEGSPSYTQAQQQIAVITQSTDVAFLDCTFTNAIQHAVHLDQIKQLRIENCSFMGGAGNGLILSNSKSDKEFTMKNSVVTTQTGEMALMLNQADLVVINCTVEGGIESSVVATFGSVMTLRACTVKNSPKTAVLVRDQASATLLNCTFNNIYGNALNLIQASTHVTECQWFDIKGIGVLISGQSIVNLNTCEFEKIAGCSLVMNGPCFVTASDIQITHSNFDVISMENNAYCTLQSARFDQSKQISIYLKDSTLAYSNTEAILKNEIQIHSENSHCFFFNT